MKQIVAGIIFLGCCYLLKLSVSEKSMKEITDSRYQSDNIFSSSKFKYGDLFGLSYLRDFQLKEDKFPRKPNNIKADAQDLSLHIISDSYVFSPFWDKKAYFSRTAKLKFYPWKDKNWDNPILDSTLINVAIIEVIERERVYNLNLANIENRWPIQKEEIKSDPIIVSKDFFENAFSTIRQSAKWMCSFFYHPNLEAHLEFIMFDFNFFLPLKLWKADFNFRLFNRINSDVVMSEDHKNLYVKTTIDEKSPGSSFRKIDDKEIEDQVVQMNEISQNLKNRGFQKVVFTLIPNPVAALKTESKPINDFVFRVQNNPKLQVDFLDLNKDLSKNPSFYFCKSDTHWNSNGVELWIFKVNNYLNSIHQ